MLEAGAPADVVANPLRQGLAEERVPEPAAMVIFGASGDLAHRKLLPALYSLTRDRLLPSRFAIIGFARRAMTDEAFRDELRTACAEHARRRPLDTELWSAFAAQHLLPAGELRRPRLVRCAQAAPRGDRTHARAARQPRLLSRHAAVVVRGGDPRPGPRRAGAATAAPGGGAPRAAAAVRARHHREAVRHRSGDGARAEPRRSTRRWTSGRSTESITTWARRPSRTCWCSGSRTASSSRCGTTTSSITSRSPAPRASASRRAAATSSRPAACATWCRTTCCRS